MFGEPLRIRSEISDFRHQRTLTLGQPDSDPHRYRITHRTVRGSNTLNLLARLRRDLRRPRRERGIRVGRADQITWIDIDVRQSNHPLLNDRSNRIQRRARQPGRIQQISTPLGRVVVSQTLDHLSSSRGPQQSRRI